MNLSAEAINELDLQNNKLYHITIWEGLQNQRNLFVGSRAAEELKLKLTFLQIDVANRLRSLRTLSATKKFQEKQIQLKTEHAIELWSILQAMLYDIHFLAHPLLFWDNWVKTRHVEIEELENALLCLPNDIIVLIHEYVVHLRYGHRKLIQYITTNKYYTLFPLMAVTKPKQTQMTNRCVLQ
jgi:hypothetical protein